MDDTSALQLADIIRQTAREAHTFLQHGHQEKVYREFLRAQLRRKHFRVEEFVLLSAASASGPVVAHTADLVINRKVIVELEVVRSSAPKPGAPLLDYLRASGREHALLINFGGPRIQFRKYPDRFAQ